jgi:phage host-nuclease inhibitor protein Gam
MFNIFPKKKSVDEIIGNVGPFDVYRPTQTPSYLQAQQEVISELIKKYNNLNESVEHLRGEAEKFYEENKKLKDQLNSIEEDGTEEHNAAIKLRQENAKLKKDFEDQKQLKDSLQRVNEKYIKKIIKQQYSISELTKEVRDLRHLKKENVELMERVNEIDSDMNKEYQDEIFTLKNEIAVLKNRNTELLEKYNGIITMGGLKYMEARLQIVQNDYKKCSEERDEYKHQLNAANKEIEVLKKDIVDYVFDKDEEINELKKTQDWKETVETLKNMKTQGFEDYDPSDFEVKVEKYYVCNHCGYKLAHDTNYWGGCGFCKEGLMIEKEVEEVVDTLKNMKTQGFEDYDPSDFVKTEIQIAEEEILKRELKRINDLQEETADESLEQKHPMHPLHWGGYDGAASAYPEQYSKWLNVMKEKAERLTKDVKVDLDKPIDEQCDDKTTAENLEKKFDEEKNILDYFTKVKVTTTTIGEQEDKWKCPCNICKEGKVSWEQAASDLALRVIKLEKQIEELKIVNIWKQS